MKKAKYLLLENLPPSLNVPFQTLGLSSGNGKPIRAITKMDGTITLPQVPKFDHHGLWRYERVSFSQYGNLKKTIIHLVASAPAGLTGKELDELLWLSPQSFMHHFRDSLGICREKHDGVYVYFSEDIPVYEKQVRQRKSIVCRQAVVTITDAEAIMILVALIWHHGISAEELLSLPEIKKSKMKLAAIQGFLECHGLEKKILDSWP